jgi:hypothetical protein
MSNYREMWKEVAGETGGEYVEYGRLPKMPRIVWNDGGREFVVEVFQSMGDLDTRGQAVLIHGKPFNFEAHFRSVFTMLGGLFGRKGISTGDRMFDKSIIIKGDDPVRIRNLFSHARIRELLPRQKKEHWFYLRQADGLENESGGPVWTLVYWELGIQKDKQRLLDIYELMRDAMRIIDK